MLFMHTEEKRVSTSSWLRLGGTLIGATLSAVSAVILFVAAAALDILNGAATFQIFLAGLTFSGACAGFALPRQTFRSLWFFLPEIFDSPSSSRPS
jgi:hypothetical protein